MVFKGVVGFIPGVFDLVHAGHVLAFLEAKKSCDYLIVGLEEDPSVDRPSKRKPVLTVAERLTILQAIRYVDEVIVYSGEDGLEALDRELEYHVRFIGADHRGKLFRPISRSGLADRKIIYVSRNHNYSSSNIFKRIQDRGK